MGKLEEYLDENRKKSLRDLEERVEIEGRRLTLVEFGIRWMVFCLFVWFASLVMAILRPKIVPFTFSFVPITAMTVVCLPIYLWSRPIAKRLTWIPEPDDDD